MSACWHADRMEPTHIAAWNVAPMLAEPREGAEMVSQVIYGEPVSAMEREDSYLRIRTPDGYEGWTPARALSPWGPEILARTEVRRIVTLLEPLYSDSDGITQRTLLTVGSEVRVLPNSPGPSGLIEVVEPSGNRAWIRSSALETADQRSELPLHSVLTATAMRFVGVPYLWGGRTPFGMDCSGFTQLVYAIAGYLIPRDAHLQAAWDGLDTVGCGEPCAGDLLFFGGETDPRRRGIVHVGLALDHDRFVHSAGGVGVTIGSLSEDSSLRRYLRKVARLRAPVT